MEHSESVALILAARAHVYQTLQTLLGVEPTPASLNFAASDESLDAFHLFDIDRYGKYRRVLETAEASLVRLKDGEARKVSLVKDEYTRLFIGPGKLDAPPWESVYATKERLLFQKTTLDVRSAYRAQGFEAQAYPSVADDHIAIELDFMASLGKRAQIAYADGKMALMSQAMKASAAFIDNHLGQWIDVYANALEEVSNASLYPELVNLMKAFVPLDRDIITGFS